MWKKTILFSFPVLLSVGFGSSVYARDPYPTLQLAQHAPDNTGRNERDQSGKTLTPGDQSSNKADIELTRRIREAVVADKSLSTDAHNVKIPCAPGLIRPNRRSERNPIADLPFETVHERAPDDCTITRF